MKLLHRDQETRLIEILRHVPQKHHAAVLREIETLRAEQAAGFAHDRRIIEDEAALLRAKVAKLAETRRRLLEHNRRDAASFRKFRQAIRHSRAMHSLAHLPALLPQLKETLAVSEIGLALCSEDFAEFLPDVIPFVRAVSAATLETEICRLCQATPPRPFLGLTRRMPRPDFFLPPDTPATTALMDGSCFVCGLKDKFRRDRLVGAVAFFDPAPGRYTPDKATDFLEHFCDILAADLINVRDHEKLDRETVIDELTTAPNRAYLTRHAPRMLEFSGRKGFPVCALFIDLDKFKSINDTLGHAAGDRVLTAVAMRLKESMRRYDIFARLGGDEFVAILPDTDMVEAADMAARIARAVSGLSVPRITGLDTPLGVSASVGLARLEPGESLDALIRRADADMYAVKRGGPSPDSPA
ncbi:GGDEF domain-containing protein [Desulfolutivibrio sp.]|uniref:GGDEF domain-containing protein n=1 Tax=Desulfolutivibrio sp. TaxID=2773296 RepID=UPI002F9617D9